MKWGVIVFPGSNCDHDCYHVVKHALGEECRFIWHKERSLGDVDAVIVPGGFSYGDYLRSGAIARFSPIMEAVRAFADSGGFVLGICNGFQVLLEAGLLPGAMLRNSGLKFICRHVHLRVENSDTPFTNLLEAGQVVTVPIAHNEGNYFADKETMAALERNGQVVFRYKNNPNGSLNDVAGICAETGRVLGLMPHPERHLEPWHHPAWTREGLADEADGLRLFRNMVEAAG